MRLPASALMFRAAGLQVATLGPNNRVVMKPITIDTDLGTQVIVASGISAQGQRHRQPAGFAGQWRPGARGRRCAMRINLPCLLCVTAGGLFAGAGL